MNKFIKATMTGLLGYCACVTAAFANYKLQTGDEVEVSVAGLPELTRKGKIDIDGRATFPLVQSIALAGLTLDEAEAALKKSYGARLFQTRTPDGKEIATAISPGSVTVSMSEYRPIYLNGDVTKPGAQPFRPGLTVRQAISLAGGYEIMRFRMNNPFIESADFSSEYQSLWAQHSSLTARMWRLEAELEGQTPLDKKVPEAKGMDEQALERAARELKLRQENSKAARRHLDDAIRRSDGQLSLLTSRSKEDEEGARADAVEYKKLMDFAQRGQLASTRLSESRRLLLFSTTQVLQTRVQMAQVERERATSQREIEKLTENRRLEILKELETANTDLARVKAKIGAVAEKMTYTGLVRSQLVRGGGERPKIRIVRATKEITEDAGEDAEVRPGDTIEVSLNSILPLPEAGR